MQLKEDHFSSSHHHVEDHKLFIQLFKNIIIFGAIIGVHPHVS
jgi:hypothetical protein